MEKKPPTNAERAKSALPLLYMVIALFALRWTIVEPYMVPTGSMEPTLKTGDRLHALKCAYHFRVPFTNFTLFKIAPVKRGDVILFESPTPSKLTYVKRAIGLPGDKITMKNGVLYINDHEVFKVPAPERTVMYDIDDEDIKTLYVEDLEGLRHYVILDNSDPNPGSRFIPRRPYDLVPRDGVSYIPTTVPPGMIFAMGDNRDNSSDSRVWGFVPEENLLGRAMFIWFSFWQGRIRYERIGTLIQ